MRLRSLRNRLALVFGLIVLGSLTVVYLAVVPQLEQELREQKLQSLAGLARGYVAVVQAHRRRCRSSSRRWSSWSTARRRGQARA